MGPLPKIVAQIRGDFDLGRGYHGAPTDLPPWCSVCQLEDPHTTRGPLETIVEFIKTWEGFLENDQKMRPRRISKWAPESKGLT